MSDDHGRSPQRALRRLRSDRGLLGWLAAVCGALLLAATVPMTASGFTAAISNAANRAGSKAAFTCADVFASESRTKSAFFEYSLLRRAGDRAGGTTATDLSPQGNTGTYDGARGQDTAASRPCSSDPGDPYALDGSSSRVITSKRFDPIRGDFSIEIWFKTSARSEKIMGFEGSQSDTSGNYDKHLYVDTAGRLRFAIYNSDGNTTTATSTSSVDDGQWHQAVATASSTAGCVLYLDGAVAGTNPKTVAEDFGGWWRIGEGNTEGWPDAPTTSHFTGSLAFAGAYGAVLTAAEVRSAYDIGKPPPAPTATPTPDTSASATAAPEATATPVPVASGTPSDTPTATPVAGPPGGRATLAPAPESSDISTVPSSDSTSTAGG